VQLLLQGPTGCPALVYSLTWLPAQPLPCLATQSFSAGVGNWVADEVLYQAAIHPEQPANSIPAEQVGEGEEARQSSSLDNSPLY
jgi:hypothetical protein